MDFEKHQPEPDPYAASPPPPPPVAQAPGPAGWYTDPQGTGSYRYWDGGQWTDAVSSAVPTGVAGNLVSDSRNMAMLAHLSGLLLGFIGPLIFYLIKPEDPFVRRHSIEALNFNLSVLLYMMVLAVGGAILTLIIIGIFLFFLMIPLYIVAIVFMIMAAVKANRGEEYQYPLTIRFITS